MLKASREGRVQVVTSDVTAAEISKIPDQHRRKHEVISQLLSQVPLAARYSASSGLMLMGVGGGTREDPIATAIKGILDDDGDVDHVFQAAKNGARYFVTVDEKTILTRADRVKEACGVYVVRPTDLLAVI